jgi:hypothetical protein
MRHWIRTVENVKGKALPIQWKGTIARILNGTIIRMHEIANAGKPILDIQRRAHSPMWKSTEACGPTDHLIVLHGAIDETICVVVPSG